MHNKKITFRDKKIKEDLCPKRIIVIVLQRIGDVLLATPIAESFKKKWPDVEIDFLVNKGTEDILGKRGERITNILTFDKSAGVLDHLKLYFKLFRKYDLAVSTQAGDRSLFLAWISGKKRVSSVPGKKKLLEWKKLICSGWVEDNNSNRHVVESNLMLVDAIAVEPVSKLSIPYFNVNYSVDEFITNIGSFVVIHPCARYIYKNWNKDSWVKLIEKIIAEGFYILISGGPDEKEVNYCREIKECFVALDSQVISIAGRFNFSELAYLLSKSCFYIGVDTSVTHMAAAIGVPVFCLYGPTNPVKWGPWPKGYDGTSSPFVTYDDTYQNVNNVLLIQGSKEFGCIPCQEEGCYKNLNSKSLCLESINFDKVFGLIKMKMKKM